MTTSIVISIISLSLCVSGFFFFRWYIARKIAASSLLTKYREEVYRLIAEIDAATDRDSLLVEERIKTLKQILDNTDRRISVFMRELQRNRNAGEMYASLGRGIRAALDSRPSGEDAKQENAATLEMEMALAAYGAHQAHGASAAGEASAQAAPKEGPQAPKTPAARKHSAKKHQTLPDKPKKKVQIAEMSAQGAAPSEIASSLGLSLAEVDLALNLLRRPV